MHPSLPAELLNSLEGAPGFSRRSFEQIHQSGEQVISVRINPQKIQGPGEFFSAEKLPVQISKIPWSSQGYYLSQRPQYTLDPRMHAGAYYVQEASSMFLESAIRQCIDLAKPLRVLDLCAAPGGKSTLIQSILSAGSLLVSNELIKSRVNILEENMTKWGGVNGIVTNNDPSSFSRLEDYFDLIIVDAPCSGSGLFRRDPEAISEWSNENVRVCSLRQQRILADAWPALKEDGLLIYSTCSYSMEENEMLLDKISDDVKMESLQLKITAGWNIVESISPRKKYFGYRFYPDKSKGEGFFIACLRKKEGGSFVQAKSSKSSFEKINKTETELVRPYWDHDDSFALLKHRDLLFTIPANLVNDLAYLQKSLYLKKSGIVIGKSGAKELVPHHQFAMSGLVSSNIPKISLIKEDSIRYLRKEEFSIHEAAKGWNLIQFEGINLGWIKMLDKRFNNYYPVEWRIRMNVV